MFVSIKPLHVSVFFHDHLQGVLRCALCRYYSSRWFAFVEFVLLRSMWPNVYIICNTTVPYNDFHDVHDIQDMKRETFDLKKTRLTCVCVFGVVCWWSACELFRNVCGSCASLLYLCKLLYMFRVVTPPIIRRTYNCNYTIWHWSNRLCYLPLWWRISNFCTIAESSRDGLTSDRCCNYSYMRSWWWVELTPKTRRAVYRNIINSI